MLGLRRRIVRHLRAAVNISTLALLFVMPACLEQASRGLYPVVVIDFR